MRNRALRLYLCCVLCLAGALPAVSAVAQSADIIAVFDIESSDTSLDEATMTRLNNYMYGRLASAGFKLTPQDQVRERVVELKRESHKECYDQSCQIELGKTVAAQKSLSSRLIQIADLCLLQSVIYDLRTETSDKGADARGPCTAAGIMASIDQVVAKFKGEPLTKVAASGGRVEAGQVFDRGADIVNEPTDESGFLIINSAPAGATISINGKKVGQAPLHLEYPAGQYIVVAELGRLYHPSRQAVSLTKQGARVTLDLKPAFGSAKITSSPPKAQVWLEGELVGETPLEIPQKLSGTYELRLQLPDYLPSESELVIKDGQESSHHKKLVSNWGQIHVTTDPPGAAVYLDDVLLEDKTTPCLLERVKPGVHIVKFSLPGHGERSEKTTVVRGKDASISTKLQPMLGRLVVTSSYPDGVVCEGSLKLDGKVVGQTPWLGDVLAVSHKVEVQCPNGWGSEQVVVPHNGRSEVNVPVSDRPSVPPKSAFKTTPSFDADEPTSQEPEPTHDEPKPKPSERPVTFPLSLSITEGFYVIDDDDFSDSEPVIGRRQVEMGVDLGFKIKAVPWLVPTVGFWLQLERPHIGTFRPGIKWYLLTRLFIRTSMLVLLSSESAVGFLGGFGVEFILWRDGFLTIETQVGFWNIDWIPVDFLLGIGHRF